MVPQKARKTRIKCQFLQLAHFLYYDKQRDESLVILFNICIGKAPES